MHLFSKILGDFESLEHFFWCVGILQRCKLFEWRDKQVNRQVGGSIHRCHHLGFLVEKGLACTVPLCKVPVYGKTVKFRYQNSSVTSNVLATTESV